MKLLQRLAGAVDGRDVLLAIGVGLLGYGIWLVYPPAGFAVPGAVLAYVAIAGVR